MNEWLTRQADAIASGAGVSRERLELDDAGSTTLLDLARIAAHESGDRTNAPLLCYLVGVAHAAGARSLDELAEIVRSTS